MKKIILTFMCCLMLSQVVWGAGITDEKCANGGGRVVLGVNGKKYCLSNIELNWWNAMIWCRANGMELINLSEDCDCPTDICTTKCPNISGTTGWGGNWTQVSRSADIAYVVPGHSSGNVGVLGKSQVISAWALCSIR